MRVTHDTMSMIHGHMCCIHEEEVIESSARMLAHENASCQKQAADHQGTKALNLSKAIGILCCGRFEGNGDCGKRHEIREQIRQSVYAIRDQGL